MKLKTKKEIFNKKNLFRSFEVCSPLPVYPTIIIIEIVNKNQTTLSKLGPPTNLYYQLYLKIKLINAKQTMN